MKPTPEIQQVFHGLLSALREQTLTGVQKVQLDRLLGQYPALRDDYVDYVLLCAELHAYQILSWEKSSNLAQNFFKGAEDNETDIRNSEPSETAKQDTVCPPPATFLETDTPSQRGIPIQSKTTDHTADIEAYAKQALEQFKADEKQQQEELAYKEYLARRRRIMVSTSSLAALLIIALLIWLVPAPKSTESELVTVVTTPPLVATIIKARDAMWDQQDFSTDAGTRLSASGLFLKQGLIQIGFDNGAEVILQAPCDLQLEGPGRLFLRSGTVSAIVPERAEGFSIRTLNGTITDYGTEFSVITHERGDTQTQVYEGRVEVQGLTQPNEPGVSTIMLIKHEAARISAAGKVTEHQFRQDQVIREMPEDIGFGIPGRRFSLADAFLGGNGFGTGSLDDMVDIRNGRVVPCNSQKYNIRLDTAHATEAASLPYVDYLFVPDGGERPVQISSTGFEFFGCPDTDGVSFAFCRVDGFLGMIGIGFRELSLNGETYGTLDAPLLSLHANTGITFDLKAIRSSLTGGHIDRFTALCGISKTAREHAVRVGRLVVDQADFWVLVDGKIGFRALNLSSLDGGVPVDMPLNDSHRFLTLMVTCSGTHGYDWGLFADPALELSDREKLE